MFVKKLLQEKDPEALTWSLRAPSIINSIRFIAMPPLLLTTQPNHRNWPEVWCACYAGWVSTVREQSGNQRPHTAVLSSGTSIAEVQESTRPWKEGILLYWSSRRAVHSPPQQASTVPKIPRNSNSFQTSRASTMHWPSLATDWQRRFDSQKVYDVPLCHHTQTSSRGQPSLLSNAYWKLSHWGQVVGVRDWQQTPYTIPELRMRGGMPPRLHSALTLPEQCYIQSKTELSLYINTKPWKSWDLSSKGLLVSYTLRHSCEDGGSTSRRNVVSMCHEALQHTIPTSTSSPPSQDLKFLFVAMEETELRSLAFTKKADRRVIYICTPSSSPRACS
jgi:hypothetical protein